MQQQWYVRDFDLAIRSMTQLVAPAGESRETAETDHVQAVSRELLKEFGQLAECTANLREDTNGGMLVEFCRWPAEMLGKAKARLHPNTHHSKTVR
jgi:hypothetical protein